MHFKTSTKTLQQILTQSDTLLKNGAFFGKKIYMFSAGLLAKLVVRHLKNNGVTITAFLDNDATKHGLLIDNIPVISPNELKNAASDSAIIIASVYAPKMMEQLLNLGITDNIYPLDLPDPAANAFLPKGAKEMSKEQIQANLLDTMSFIHETCERHNIRYTIAYATLIGAIRHGGFIPWDEDLDIWIDAKETQKLAAAINKSGRYQMITAQNCAAYCNTHPIIVDTHTTLFMNHFPLFCQTGIYIDVMPLYPFPQDPKTHRDFATELLNKDTAHWEQSADISLCNQLAAQLDTKLSALPQTDFIGTPFIRYFTKTIFRHSLLNDRVMLAFEDRQFWAPAAYDEILTQVYGDYMTPPKTIRDHHQRAYMGSDLLR